MKSFHVKSRVNIPMPTMSPSTLDLMRRNREIIEEAERLSKEKRILFQIRIGKYELTIK